MCRLMRTVKDVALVGGLCFTASVAMWGRDSSHLMTGAVTPYTVQPGDSHKATLAFEQSVTDYATMHRRLEGPLPMPQCRRTCASCRRRWMSWPRTFGRPARALGQVTSSRTASRG